MPAAPPATPYTPPNTPHSPPPTQVSGSASGPVSPTIAKGTAPDWLVFGLGLLITGGIAEVLSAQVSDRAGLLFALLVVMGYAATGGRLSNAVAFFERIGVIAGRV